jgi:2'-5' RNA ligase
MTLAIVAYPDLEEDDRQWIEAFRRTHDVQAARIAVHFTLVFPLDGVLGDFESDTQAVVRTTRPIPFSIRHARAVPGMPGGVTPVVLIPDEGSAHIVELHDQLYAGRLRVHLRPDIPFTPHMTIGAARNSESADRLVSELGARLRIVHGTIRTLDLVDVGNARVRTVRTYSLGDTAGVSD